MQYQCRSHQHTCVDSRHTYQYVVKHHRCSTKHSTDTNAHDPQENATVISVSKGIHVETHMLMDEIFSNTLGSRHTYIYLSGPSFASEIVDGHPTTFVLASTDKQVLERTAASIFDDTYTRVTTTSDTRGVLIAGACKNVYAIGAGVIQALNYGYNTITMFILAAMKEMTALCALVQSTEPNHTIYYSCGLGDLILTSFGQTSRNHQLGVLLATNTTNSSTVQHFLRSTIVEGVPTTQGTFA
uniref:Glycerol-3-phosphate dehydrogenase [NAD(+)] n=2 Tax=Lygus hesperus TaxID=30085 RepID=A0A0A9X0X4_LYGHE